MKRKFYEKATVQILRFQEEDVITSSTVTERGVQWDDKNWTSELTDVFQ